MNTTEIIHALSTNKCTKKYFRGCFAADKLPIKFKKPAFFVVNTQESHLPGSHWVSIFVDTNKTGEFFDSLGGPPTINHHIKFIKKHCKKKCIYNDIPIQGPFSIKCGQFSILYLLYKVRCKTINYFLNFFSRHDFEFNDRIIDEMFNVNFSPISFIQASKYKVDCNQIG